MGSPVRTPRYDAFIAYSHAPRSVRIAEAVQAGLQRFARPWYRARAARVFRDTTDLTATPQLWADIQAALADSRWFILVTSPPAARSPWVRREIQWWLANRSIDRLIIVVADGVLLWDDERRRLNPQLSTAAPDELVDAYQEEPLWIDLTVPDAGSEELAMRRGIASIAARMRGIALDAVYGEHVRQQRRTRRIVALVISVLVLLAGGAVAASVVAIRQRDEAVAAADRAASRSLILQSRSLRTAQLDRALLTGIAAVALDTSPQAQANLVAALAGSRFAGTLPGPPSGVTMTRFAPTGRIAVTSHVNGDVRLWDVTEPARARLLSTINPAHGTTYGVVWRPDGRLLALSGGDMTVSLWDVADPAQPRLVSRLPPQRTQVRSGGPVAFDATGRRLYTGGDNLYGVDGEGVRIWDVSVPERPVQTGLVPVKSDTVDITADPRGAVVAVAGTGGVQLWATDGDQPRELIRIDAHRDTVYSATFTPDGRTLVTSSQDRTVLIWDVTDPAAARQVAKLPDFPKPVFDCDTGGGGTLLACGIGDGTVAMWNIEQRDHPAEVAHLAGHADIVDTVSFSPDAALLLSGAGDGRTLVWNSTDTTAPVRRGATRPSTVPSYRMAIGPDDQTVAVNFDSARSAVANSVQLFRVAGDSPGQLLATVAPDTLGNGLALRPDGKVLLTSRYTGDALEVWDVADPTRPKRVGIIEKAGLDDAVWSPDGRMLLVNGRRSSEGSATLWDMAEPSRPRLLSSRGFGDTSISALAISPDGQTAALTTGDLAESVELWNITDPVDPVRIGKSGASHPAVIRSMAFSPHGGVLATGSNDQTVALWRVPQGDRLAVLDGHDAAVQSIAFSSDAAMVVVLDDTGTLTLWDVAEPTTPVRLHTIAAPNDAATSFALGRDGRRIIVARASGALEVLDIHRLHDIVSDPVRAACQLTGRGLTEEEWRLYVPERPFRTTC